jgi:hypothetical protein
MKTLKTENYAEYVLSNEEMVNVRGGIGGPVMVDKDPTRPPIIIEL